MIRWIVGSVFKLNRHMTWQWTTYFSRVTRWKDFDIRLSFRIQISTLWTITSFRSEYLHHSLRPQMSVTRSQIPYGWTGSACICLIRSEFPSATSTKDARLICMIQYEKIRYSQRKSSQWKSFIFTVSTIHSWLELLSLWWCKCFASCSRSRFYLSWRYARGIILAPTTRKRVSLITRQNSITLYILGISASLYRHFSNDHIVIDQVLIVQISTRRSDSDGSSIRYSLKYKDIECIVFRNSAFCIQSRKWERKSRCHVSTRSEDVWSQEKLCWRHG